MIKVEVKEGNFEVNPTSRAPALGSASPVNRAARTPLTSAVSFTPSPPPSSAPPPTSLPHLTPMPPLLRTSPAGLIPGPPIPPLASLPPQHPKAGGPSALAMEEMMTKSNLFHFGDVSVVNHPDAPPVPMVLPMAYLLPIPGAKDFRYRVAEIR